MHKVRRALQVLLCVGSPWVMGVHCVDAAEGSASPRDSTSANAAASNDSAQRDWRERLRRSSAATPGSALFESKNWLPEPPPQRPVARAPEAPRVPPFPYQFLGRLEADGQPRTVYLTKNSEVYSATPGEVIEGTYRVIDVTAESMEVLYLPLNMKQQIAFANIVPTVARQGSRTSDTPAIVAPTSVSIPPPMNVPPPGGFRARHGPGSPNVPGRAAERTASEPGSGCSQSRERWAAADGRRRSGGGRDGTREPGDSDRTFVESEPGRRVAPHAFRVRRDAAHSRNDRGQRRLQAERRLRRQRRERPRRTRHSRGGCDPGKARGAGAHTGA